MLVIKLRHHGDVLLTSPVFQVLQNHYPHLEVDALVYDDTRPMLEHHPAVRQIHTVGREWKHFGPYAKFKAELALLRDLKLQRYDLVIHLTESRRGAWLCRMLKPRYAVVRRYENRRDKFWLNSFTHHYKSIGGNRRHTVEMHLDALRRIGLQASEDERRLVMCLDSEAEQRVNELFKLSKLKGRYIHIHPTSRWLFKCWSVEKCSQLINRLSASGHQIVLTAAPSSDELKMIEQITSRLTMPIVNLSGQLRLQDLAVVVARARLFIGVDSVPMHIAAAQQTPCVTMFGPSGEVEWGPWQSPHQLITSDRHPCRPCGQDGCGNSKVSDCLEQLGLDRVVNAVQLMLTQAEQ
ncbi:putative lipopolysaccharide heptosyltransferase III [Pokkaliibacter plantistimulans]|uniref:putative lipopolysaccharide heptosyltransferase III n=1 Tax=Pokkaliibacter plantistimulans TaxID=1635171 RepID=UPI001A9CA34F|nr:putative lipopolysaccharide heptosyltransferase III [Pokkaliibacter plantistimulans]